MTSSTPTVTSLQLWIPPVTGAAVAVVVVIWASVFAWRMSNGMKFREWIVGAVYGGPAWTAKDSWVTNIAVVGGLLGTIITDSSTPFKGVITADPLAGITLLFIVFSGAAATAPVIYGATSKVESEGITNTKGSVWGFMLAGAASILAVIGEMATIGQLMWAVSDSTPGRWSIVIALGVAALAVAVYSTRSLMYFAILPGVRPPPKDPTATKTSSEQPTTRFAARRSLLGNGSFSATL